MWITHNNILHKCIDVVLNPNSDKFNWSGVIPLNIGKKVLIIPYSEIRFSKTQTIIFKGQGISKINTKNSYDISERSDIMVHITLSFQN